jgi:hypothetical protein
MECEAARELQVFAALGRERGFRQMGSRAPISGRLLPCSRTAEPDPETVAPANRLLRVLMPPKPTCTQ